MKSLPGRHRSDRPIQYKVSLQTFWFCLLPVILHVTLKEVVSQTTETPIEYDEATPDPSLYPTEDTLSYPDEEEGTMAAETPTISENRPDLSPIIKEITQSCCAIPALDCSFAFSQSRKKRDSDGTTELFPNLMEKGQMRTSLRMPGSTRPRKKRQAELSSQFIDQLGINLLRFETCLCQSVRPLSTCRMLFPPDYYKPSVPAIFETIFHGLDDRLLKRFACTFYASNTVDCTFRASIRYPSVATDDVTDEVRKKALESGAECGACNSFYCTFDAFKKRMEGAMGLYNTDYNQCMTNRTGLPAEVLFPPPPPTKRAVTLATPLPPLPPLTFQQKYSDRTVPGLSFLSHLMTSGIFRGLGIRTAEVSFPERYLIRTPVRSKFHPVHSHDHYRHHGNGYLLKIILAVVIGLIIGAIIMAVIIFVLYRRQVFTKKLPVQRSLRDLPIVKLDVLDPSPFCGHSRDRDPKRMADIYMGSAQSDTSSYCGGSLQESLYRSIGSSEGRRGSCVEGTLPVARVVPLPKPPKRPSGHSAGVAQAFHPRASVSTGSPPYSQANRRKAPSYTGRPAWTSTNVMPRITARRDRGNGIEEDHVIIRHSRSTPSASGYRPDVIEFSRQDSSAVEEEEEEESNKYQSVYAKVDDFELDQDGHDTDQPTATSDRPYDKKIIYYSGHTQAPASRTGDHYEIPVKRQRPPKPTPVPPLNTMPRTVAPPLPMQRNIRRTLAPPPDRSSTWSTKTEWDPDDVQDSSQSEDENEYMEIRDEQTALDWVAN